MRESTSLERGSSPHANRTIDSDPVSFPVFFADRIRTPLLIQFGDEDGAVPWYPGIELYLAMRRLGRDCIFLQYHGESHRHQKYPIKLDYATKTGYWLDMKEFDME